jgi:hypothetical protein
MVWNFGGPTHCSKKYRIMRAQNILPVVGHHLAMALKIFPTRKIEMIKLQINAKFVCAGLDDPQAFRHDFFANAIACDYSNSFFTHINLLN